MVLEELHAADRAVVRKQNERGNESETKPGGGKLLNRPRLIFFEEGQNDDCAEGRATR